MFRTTYFPEHRQLDQMDFGPTCLKMLLIKRIALFIGLLMSLIGNSQETNTHFTFLELEKLEEEALYRDHVEKLRRLSEIHADKGKSEKNLLEVAKAFYYRVTIEELEIGLAYSDSIILLTENYNHRDYPTLGFLLKGHLQYESGKSREALENYLKAYNLSITKKNPEHQREASLAIAAIRNLNGQHSAAATLYKESLELLMRQSDYRITRYEDYLILLHNLSVTNIRLSQLDSAKYYINRGLASTVGLKDMKNFQDFVLLDAELNYYRKNYQRSRDSIKRYIDLYEGTNRAIKLYYLSKSEQKLGNNLEATKHFKEIDSIVNITNDPFHEIKDVYQQLIIQASLDGNLKKQIYYIEKLIKYDSILSSDQRQIADKVIVAYDIPYLKHQKQKAEEQLKMKSLVVNGVGVLAFLSTCSGLFFYYRSRKMKYRLALLLEGTSKEQINVKVINEHPISVPADIREDILQKLKKFEQDGSYLRKDLDMSNLAVEFGTNTSYLSTVVNHYKKMSFPNYIKDLKISSAILQLKLEPGLLKYNYQGLAENFGFKTADSFSKAFYKKTGVYPSRFLRELKARR